MAGEGTFMASREEDECEPLAAQGVVGADRRGWGESSDTAVRSRAVRGGICVVAAS